jgi:hypothetical protein
LPQPPPALYSGIKIAILSFQQQHLKMQNNFPPFFVLLKKIKLFKRPSCRSDAAQEKVSEIIARQLVYATNHSIFC